MRPREYYDFYHIDIDYLDMSDVVSDHECTGLIPAGEAELEKDDEYREMYQFGVPLREDDEDDYYY